MSDGEGAGLRLGVLAERVFTAVDQERFAALSGDRNPLHMDAVAARRMIAGAPVVHGVHTCLWSLECLFAGMAGGVGVQSLTVLFAQAVFVGDLVRVEVTGVGEGTARLKGFVEAAMVFDIRVVFGAAVVAEAGFGGPLLEPAWPRALEFEALAGERGRVPFARAAAEGAALFPAMGRVVGAGRVGGLMAASTLVGMVCPGLHSVFGGFVLSAAGGGGEALSFRVQASDARFGLVKMEVGGAGWAGVVTCYVRPKPVEQPGMEAVGRRVRPGEFAGASMLVIGGSRGLGELIAKIGAAGGARVTISYAVGMEDARRVQAAIEGHGGQCGILRYDVRAGAGQLEALPGRPDAVYYLATPTIAQGRRGSFQPKRFGEFLEYYVDGFARLCGALKARFEGGTVLFYPSSVYVEACPVNLTEYGMAKAAGEILCRNMLAGERPGPIVVRRLPRLPTDQTASVLEAEPVDALEVLLEVVRDVHRARVGG